MALTSDFFNNSLIKLVINIIRSNNCACNDVVSGKNMVYNGKSESCRNIGNHSRGFDMDNIISSVLRVCNWERCVHIFGWMGKLTYFSIAL